MAPATEAKAPPARAAVARPALRPAEARALADADRRYKKAKRELEEVELERKDLIRKALPKVKLGVWVKAGGWAIKITMQNSGQRFSLSEYLKEYKLTRAMRKFVSAGSDSPRLTVEADK